MEQNKTNFCICNKVRWLVRHIFCDSPAKMDVSTENIMADFVEQNLFRILHSEINNIINLNTDLPIANFTLD